MSIAIIPARGGSKRIPRKNIKLFQGIPVIAYAINAAKESGVFDEILVSTDDLEIGGIAKSYGAVVPQMRPKELSDDFATTLAVMQYEIGKLKLNMKNPKNVCCIYPATPLLQSKHLTEAVSLLENGNWNYVFSAIANASPPERSFELGEELGVKLLFPGNELTRTQDFVTSYQDAGQFYWGTSSSWESGVPIFSSRSTIYELPSQSVVDIDSERDWHYAEFLFKSRKNG